MSTARMTTSTIVKGMWIFFYSASLRHSSMLNYSYITNGYSFSYSFTFLNGCLFGSAFSLSFLGSSSSAFSVSFLGSSCSAFSLSFLGSFSSPFSASFLGSSCYAFSVSFLGSSCSCSSSSSKELSDLLSSLRKDLILVLKAHRTISSLS